ncbi:MAG: hypothetical protein H6Q16_407 [Bacteroidetes bacterium]|nr:hypothetical protein [Bacteroidota bacterium]
MKKILLIIAGILITSTINAQSEFEQLKNYYPFGISVGVNRLSEPELIRREKGIKPVNAYNPIIGLEYELFPSKRFSYFLGANFSFVPTERFDIYVENVDGLNYNLDMKYSLETDHSKPTLTIPIGASFKGRIKNNIYYTVKAGVEVSFLFGNNELGYSMGEIRGDMSNVPVNVDSISKVSYGMFRDQSYAANGFISAGLMYAIKPLLIKADLIASFNLDNVISDDIRYGYFFIGSPYNSVSGGFYSSDMSYIGLKLTLVPRKHIKEKKEPVPIP